MAGMKVVVTKTDEKGNIDVEDLREKAILHKDNLAALMVTILQLMEFTKVQLEKSHKLFMIMADKFIWMVQI